MTILAANGTTKLSKSALLAKTTDVPVTECTVNEDIYQTYNYAPYETRFKNFEGERRLLFKAGQVVKKADIDALFPAASVTSIAPASGAAAGGTAVTIKGVNFAGASGATVGGNALTSFVVVNNTTITGTTAAHTAGATDVVVQDDSGNTPALTGAFTFV